MSANASPQPAPTPFLRRKLFRSTWLVLGLTLAALVVANIAGEARTRLVWWPNELMEVPAESSSGEEWFSYLQFYEHGWPFVFARRHYEESAEKGCWRLDRVPYYRLAPLWGNIAIGAVLLVLVGATWQWWRGRRAQWWQLHLADLLTLTLVVACGLGWYVVNQRRQAFESALADPIEAKFHEDYKNSIACGDAITEHALGGPTWLRELALGDDRDNAKRWLTSYLFFITLESRHLPGIRQATGLRQLHLNYQNQDFSELNGMRLEKLTLSWNPEFPPRPEILQGGGFFNVDESNVGGGGALREKLLAAQEEYDKAVAAAADRQFIAVRALPQLPQLKSLTITERSGVTAAQLAQYPLLEELDWRILPEDLAALESLTNLRKLVLTAEGAQSFGMGGVGLPRIEDPNAGRYKLPNFAALSQLRSLTLKGIRVADADFETICQIPSLRCLTIDHCEITGDALKFLANLEQLHHLTLVSDTIGDGQMRHFPKLPAIKDLDLSFPAITEASFPVLEAQQSVRTLRISDASIEDYGPLFEALPECNVHPEGDHGMSGGGMF